MVKKMFLAIIIAFITIPIYAVSSSSTQPESAISMPTGTPVERYFKGLDVRYLAELHDPQNNTTIGLGLLSNNQQIRLIRFDNDNNILNSLDCTLPAMNNRSYVRATINIDPQDNSVDVTLYRVDQKNSEKYVPLTIAGFNI